jgi:hypothetical protein
MLEPGEFEQFLSLLRAATPSAKPNTRSRVALALAYYEQATGFHESNINAAIHHAVELVGPPCEQCGKVLRTPTAARCLLCGSVRAPGAWVNQRRVPLPRKVEPEGD